MDLELAGRVILVAGSSRGIGKSIAASLLKEGASVCISGRDPVSLAEAERELSPMGQVAACEGDLSQPSSIEAAFETAAAQLGPLNGLVCNLGSGSGELGWNPSENDWDRLMTVNFRASTRLAQAAIPRLSARGGCIVFVSSITGVEAIAAPLPYSAAKAALISYSKNLSREVAQFNIRVNCVAPGNVLFPGGSWDRRLAREPEATRERIRAEVPIGRFGTPEEIASLVTFLCSNRASFATGSCFIMDGGQTRTI